MQNPGDEESRWRRAARLDELLHELQRQASRGSGLELQKIFNWLHRHIDTHVALVGAAGAVEASTTGFPRGILNSLTSALTRLAGGRRAVAAAQVDGMHVRLEALGPHRPHPVLVAVSASAPTREAASLTSYTGGVMAILLRMQEADKSSRSYQRKARQLRFAVFTALLTGDPSLARRMTTGAVPELLDAESLRIHLLHCTPADRDRLALTFQDPSGYHDRGMMVHCPVYREHLICLVAEEADGSGPHGQGEALRQLVRDNPGYALGISAPQPLDATAQAYDQAIHALAVARNTPGRVASYRGESPLAHLLPAREAGFWARAFLEPMNSAPKPTVDIIRFAVSLPRSGVARLLGVSRNTVTAHLKRAENLLGLDLDDVHSRALLNLALAIGSPRPGSMTDRENSAPTLDQLLRTRPATAWAHAFLYPLPEKVHATLRAWVAANTDAQRTARRLGISRNTVRARLRTAEGLLNRDLLTSGFGIHDLVHALSITQESPPSALPARHAVNGAL